MWKLRFTSKNFHERFARTSAPTQHKHHGAPPKDPCLQLPTERAESCLTAQDGIFCWFFCLHDTWQADTTHSVLLQTCRTPTLRPIDKGQKVWRCTSAQHDCTPFWEKAPAPGTLSISITGLQSCWMTRSTASQETLCLSAKKHGKRSLQSKLEIDYLSAWGFWLKIFDRMSHTYLSLRGATLL